RMLASDALDFGVHDFRRAECAEDAALANSIQQNGQLEPIVVRTKTGGGYENLDGHRRARILSRLGRPVLARVLTEIDERGAFHIALELNERREGFSDLDRAHALLAYKERFDSWDQVLEIFDIRERQAQNLVRVAQLARANLSLMAA